MTKDNQNWRDISTAPKDGTIILLWLRSGGKPVLGFRKLWTFRGWLRFECLENLDEWRSAIAESALNDPCGSLSWAEGRLLGLAHEPTHWMPLPDPPEQSE